MCLELASIRTTDTSFVARSPRSGVSHELLERRARRAGGGDRGLPADHDRPVRGRGRPVDRARARLLHRHRVRDPDGRLEQLGSICSGGRYDSLATDGRRPIPVSGFPRRHPVARPVAYSRRAHSSRSVPSVVLVALASDETRAESEAVADACGRGASPARCRQRAEVRPPDPRRRAARDPVRLVPAGDSGHEVKDIRSGDQVTPIRRPGCRPTTIVVPASSAATKERHRDPHPRRRNASARPTSVRP